jgi:Spy/CpxP family protein refolding chaperone
MNSYLRAVAAPFLAVALLAPIAVSADQAFAHGGGKRSHGDHLKKALGLTEDQVQAIRAIRARQHEAWKQHGGAMRQASADLRKLVLANADEATIQAKQAEVQKLMAESVALRTNTLREIAPVLTPEQREKMSQMEHRGRWHRGPRASS